MLLTSKKSSLGELAVIQNNLILGFVLFFPFFSKMHRLGNKKNSSKRGRWHLVVMQIDEDFFCNVGELGKRIAISCCSPPGRQGDIAASVPDLCVPQEGNCISEGFCIQVKFPFFFKFQASEILLELLY